MSLIKKYANSGQMDEMGQMEKGNVADGGCFKSGGQQYILNEALDSKQAHSFGVNGISEKTKNQMNSNYPSHADLETTSGSIAMMPSQ